MVKVLNPIEGLYIVRARVNIGFICIDSECYMIDSGLDQDQARRAVNAVKEYGVKPKALLNTHSHADHIGGNKYVTSKLGIPAYTSRIEASITLNPILEPIMLYGGYPPKELRIKLLMANPSDIGLIESIEIPMGIIDLKGHSLGMIGFKTRDYIYVGDAYLDPELIKKHKLPYNYHPGMAIKTLYKLLEYTGKGLLYISSHSDPIEDPMDIIYDNIEAIDRVRKIIEDIRKPIEVDTLFMRILKTLDLNIDSLPYYYLYRSTYHGYLSWLIDENIIKLTLRDGKVYIEEGE